MTDELTIIAPVFNEEESLPAFFIEMDRLVGPFFDTLAFRWIHIRYFLHKVAD